MKYDSYYRVGEYDLWLASSGDYRIELYRGGESGQAIWKGKFLESIPTSENHIKLKHRRGWFYFSYSTNQPKKCICELTFPRLFMGKKVIREVLSLAQSKQIYEQLQRI